MHLIHVPQNDLSPVGGPCGYLYNLKNGLDAIDCNEIDFLPALPFAKRAIRKASFLVHSHQSLEQKLEYRADELLTYLKRDNKPSVDYSRYRSIHFHATRDLYAYRKSLEHYDGSVVLTSHTPCVPFDEVYESYKRLTNKTVQSELKILEKVDEYAFQRADVVVFPCKAAEEPYYHTWKRYSDIRKEMNVQYLLTGSPEVVAKSSSDLIRNQYSIPSDAFVVSFVGRHNDIKGYPDLIKIAKKVLSQRSDVYFLIAGKINDTIDFPKSDRWIEAGWTNDPYSIINASDLFILPNRETYFDLVLIEVLSLGIPVLASCTGGNKWFSSINAPGINLFKSEDEAIESIFKAYAMYKMDSFCFTPSNKEIYREYFTVNEFARNYIRLITTIQRDANAD